MNCLGGLSLLGNGVGGPVGVCHPRPVFGVVRIKPCQLRCPSSARIRATLWSLRSSPPGAVDQSRPPADFVRGPAGNQFEPLKPTVPKVPTRRKRAPNPARAADPGRDPPQPCPPPFRTPARGSCAPGWRCARGWATGMCSCRVGAATATRYRPLRVRDTLL